MRKWREIVVRGTKLESREESIESIVTEKVVIEKGEESRKYIEKNCSKKVVRESITKK